MQENSKKVEIKRMASENKIKNLREKYVNSLKDEPEQLMKYPPFLRSSGVNGYKKLTRKLEPSPERIPK